MARYRIETEIVASGFHCIVGLRCLVCMPLLQSHIWLSFACLVVTGLLTKAMQGPCWAMPALVFPPGVVGGARGIIVGIGTLGGFLGPVLVGFLTTKTGNMTPAFTAWLRF